MILELSMFLPDYVRAFPDNLQVDVHWIFVIIDQWGMEQGQTKFVWLGFLEVIFSPVDLLFQFS